MLIEACGVIINLDDVQSIAETGTEAAPRCNMLFRDGTKRIFNTTLEYFEQTTGVIVPAPVGYVLIEARMPTSDDPSEIVYSREPILAFRIGSGEKAPIPITINGEADYFTTPWIALYTGSATEGVDDWKEAFALFRESCIGDLIRIRANRPEPTPSDVEAPQVGELPV